MFSLCKTELAPFSPIDMGAIVENSGGDNNANPDTTHQRG
jgi:hypothetical protein